MTPLVIAHRGGALEGPEHTAEAYQHALDAGVDGFECDVRLTSDGHLVCLHDRRVNRTSDGTGRVSWLTLQQLERFDFGARYPGPRSSAGARVLTLDRLLAIARDSGRRLHLLIETKHPSRFGSAVERRVIELLGRYGLASGDPEASIRPTIMSFSLAALRVLRALAPAVPAAYLFDAGVPGPVPFGWNGRAPYGASALGPGIAALRTRPGLVDRARTHGRPVYVWTVNEPADFDLCVRCGVDAVITDRPTFARAYLAAS